MRTHTKPPLLAKLFLKFYKYEEKLIISKLYNLKIKKLLAVENTSVYFLMYKNYLQQVTNNLFLTFEKYFVQNFNLSLILKSTHYPSWKNKTIYTVALQTIIEYSKFFYWKDLTLSRTKFIYSNKTNSRSPTTKFFLLKDMLFILNKRVFQKNFVCLNHLNSIFFLNIFFFPLFLGFHQHIISNNLLNRKKIFYFGLDFAKLFFFTKYDNIFSVFNRFLTIQTGILKNSSYFVDRNYVFSASAQMFRTRTLFFIKFFLKNSRFRLFQKTPIFYPEIEKDLIIDGIHVWSRSVQILPFFINKNFYIHNGNNFLRIRIFPGMVGHKLGQFSYTRKIHSRSVNLKTTFKNLG